MRAKDALCRSKAKIMKPRSIQTNALLSSTPPKYVRILRTAAWNALFVVSGLLLIALVGEVYLRLANPFIEHSIPSQFVEGVGRIRKPNAEIRYASWHDDNFVVSRANSLGFLDREPVSAERAAAGCHIAFIGDSYVEAREVPIADKFHVRLEEMAARELPHLAITTQAYGIFNTGQINQIPFYDEYARYMIPKLIVLVFYINDFYDNSVALQSLWYRTVPDRMPFMTAHRDANGTLNLRPPDPEYYRFRLHPPPAPWHNRAWKRLSMISYFAKWLDMKKRWAVNIANSISAGTSAPNETDPQLMAWMAMIAAHPCCSSSLNAEQLALHDRLENPINEERLLPLYEDALEYTAFAIEQFKLRTDRDGAKLIMLAATDEMGTQGDPQFDRLNAIAETYGIPVISQYDYMVSQRYDDRDGRWTHDLHWNATGHQWAAEAVLEWLKANQDVCD